MATTLMCWQVGGCRKLEAASSSYLATLASLVSMGGAIGSAVAGRTHAPLVCTRPYGMSCASGPLLHTVLVCRFPDGYGP